MTHENLTFIFISYQMSLIYIGSSRLEIGRKKRMGTISSGQTFSMLDIGKTSNCLDTNDTKR